MKHWYAMRSHPHKEDALNQQLVRKEIESFYPRIRVSPVNPRSRKIRPYFPGYLFVNIDIDEVGMSELNYMPYGTGLVSFGGEPAVIPDNLINAIRERVVEIEQAGGELFDRLKTGDPVQIQQGPFEGYEAIFDTRISGTQRVKVLLQLLNSRASIPIEMDAGSIKKISPKKRK
jgi:transcriptional antiterminator RfaH